MHNPPIDENVDLDALKKQDLLFGLLFIYLWIVLTCIPDSIITPPAAMTSYTETIIKVFDIQARANAFVSAASEWSE